MCKFNEYRIDPIENKIIVTKKFAKAAGVLNSPEYKILQQARMENPGFPVVLRDIRKDVLAYPVDKNHFKITVPVAISQQFFGWVFGLGKYVRIVGPDDVVEKMQKALSDITDRYL